MDTPKVAWHPAGVDACALFRMYIPHLHLPRSMFLYSYRGTDFSKIADCQVTVVQRLCSADNYKALTTFKKMGMKIVYDLDDDMWSLPPYNPAFALFKRLREGFAICANQADVITVSTQHLKIMVKKAMGKVCPRIEVIENAMDFDLFRPVSPVNRKDKNGRVTIGWAGTNTHEGDIKRVFTIIPEILRENPEVDFELVGMPMPDSWLGLKDRVRVRDFVPIAEWATNWASWQWDISLAPLENNTFNRSKSFLKMLESAAVRIPCVASKIAAYDQFCAPSPLLKKTVMAKGLGDWKVKITKLVKDAALRNEVGEEMHRVALAQHSIADRLSRWQETFASVV